MNRKNIINPARLNVMRLWNCCFCHSNISKAMTVIAIPNAGEGLILPIVITRLKRVNPSMPPKKERTESASLSNEVSDINQIVSTVKAPCIIHKLRKKFQFCRIFVTLPCNIKIVFTEISCRMG